MQWAVCLKKNGRHIWEKVVVGWLGMFHAFSLSFKNSISNVSMLFRPCNTLSHTSSLSSYLVIWFLIFQMISVERVLEYSQLPTEAPLESDKKPPDNWPNAGTIEANDMNLRYFPNSPDVLKNLTFRIREKEKVIKDEYITQYLYSFPL